MAEQKIQYNDAAAYELSMGKWSQIAGPIFLQWLAPQSNKRWIEVGCGNGAFTELLGKNCSPAEIMGVDPSEAQLSYAASRLSAWPVRLMPGNAYSLPVKDAEFDYAVMALVIFFVPDPPKGVAEMRRVVRPGGIISAYAWDLMNDGFPFNAMQSVMREMGIPPTLPPSAPVSRLDALKALWEGGGLQEVETKTFQVQRTFSDFESLWQSNIVASTIAPNYRSMASEDQERLKERMRALHTADRSGAIVCSAKVNFVKGVVPH